MNPCIDVMKKEKFNLFKIKEIFDVFRLNMIIFAEYFLIRENGQKVET